jgi:D-apionolactonase
LGLIYANLYLVSSALKYQIDNVQIVIEPDTGNLRYVRVGGIEVLRGIYAALRKRDWGTVVPTISDFKSTLSLTTFHASFRESEHAMDANVSVEFRKKGDKVELEYTFDGVSLSTYQSCRTGICVLHPRTLQGQKCEVEHNQSECENGVFPLNIKPDQPFKDVKAITFEYTPGLMVKTEFFGEVFEMEDQRNWSDASYKTYCRPQEWGSPYTVEAGKKIVHRIKLTIDVNPDLPTERKIQFGEGAMPNLGTVIDQELNAMEIERLNAFGFGHVQATMTGYQAAKKLNKTIFLQTQIPSLPAELSPKDALLLNPPSAWEKLNKVRGVQKFATSLGDFTDINRLRPTFDEIDGVAYGMNPQVHAFDTSTLFENTWTLSDQVNSARAFGAKKVVVGPIRLKGYGNDPRMHGIEAALFTLSSIAHLSLAKADFATFFDLSSLLASPASLIFNLLAPAQATMTRVWHCEPDLVVIEAGCTIIANFSNDPSDLFKLVPLDLSENIKIGIKGSHRMFTADNIETWQEVLKAPAKHGLVEFMPPLSILVL